MPPATRYSTRPVPALVLATAFLWLWHAPPLYERALTSDAVHGLEHICFLVTYLFFWWPLASPEPEARRWSNGGRVLYLVVGGMQMSILAAALTFSSHLWYAYYALLPGHDAATALANQQLGGALMWIPGTLVFGTLALTQVRA